jgi:UDPglucose--hexose-1-phosphate uridylyltransferase
VLISSERADRPNEFAHAPVHRNASIECPFCPGNEHLTPPEVLTYTDRGAGTWTLRVVPNKYPAIGMQADPEIAGAHEVIIESPEHHATLGQQLMRAVRDRMLYWKQDERIRYVQFFKNSGEAAGASLEHPHSQLIALPMVPARVREELDGSARYFEDHGRCFFCDELREGARLILETDQVQAVAPWAPRFGFETWILPKAHESHFENTEPAAVQALNGALRIIIGKLDEAAAHPAYNVILHTAPLHEPELEHYHWHLEILPRITGVAGFEWATGYFINSTEPEEYARLLRDSP